jgi:2-succinyl-5-enolpyruvyl-6-hydroxy-3-cyclohexene-1-carboxylate synthase
MSTPIFQHVLEEVIKAGVTEFCICPGSRNSPLVNCLMKSPELIKYFWYEERSAAFFALGRARATQKPVAVITTSGTASGELLPAAMEAYYTGTPLLLLTADRPRRFRGTGAPQTAEQEGLFGVYARFAQDLVADEICRIHQWDWSGPAHLNICIEEPKSYNVIYTDLSGHIPHRIPQKTIPEAESDLLDSFFQQSRSPLVIVSALPKEDQNPVTEFLLQLNAPIYCESGSGLREDPRLDHLQIRNEAGIWALSQSCNYPIDGVLRFGGIPVTRIWRDLEDKAHQLAECSLSDVPFSGLSWGRHIQCRIREFLKHYRIPHGWKCKDSAAWVREDELIQKRLLKLYEAFPTSEPALYHALSQKIAPGSMVYLGNSLPVREWDMAASFEQKDITIETSRGLNGIDGQLSTFLGLCNKDKENWAILGDLTTLYDFPALWILHTMPEMPVKVVVMNNGGGKLFARIYKDPVFQHLHDFDFEHFAKSWRVPYTCLNGTVESGPLPKQAFIEICPEPAATESFWKAYDELMQKSPV